VGARIDRVTGSIAAGTAKVLLVALGTRDGAVAGSGATHGTHTRSAGSGDVARGTGSGAVMAANQGGSGAADTSRLVVGLGVIRVVKVGRAVGRVAGRALVVAATAADALGADDAALGSVADLAVGGWLTLVLVVMVVRLGVVAELASLRLEVVHGYGREGGGAVVLGRLVVSLVDGNGGVDHGRLDGLTLNHGLDGLVDVVVVVLAHGSRSSALGVYSWRYDSLVLELGLLLSNSTASTFIVTLVDLAVLYTSDLVLVLLREDLVVLDWLDSVVVVVVVNLTVDGRVDVLVVCLGNILMSHGGVNGLVDLGVVVTRAGHEVLDGFLGLLHDGQLGLYLVKAGCDVKWCLCE